MDEDLNAIINKIENWFVPCWLEEYAGGGHNHKEYCTAMVQILEWVMVGGADDQLCYNLIEDLDKLNDHVLDSRDEYLQNLFVAFNSFLLQQLDVIYNSKENSELFTERYRSLKEVMSKYSSSKVPTVTDVEAVSIKKLPCGGWLVAYPNVELLISTSGGFNQLKVSKVGNRIITGERRSVSGYKKTIMMKVLELNNIKDLLPFLESADNEIEIEVTIKHN